MDNISSEEKKATPKTETTLTYTQESFLCYWKNGELVGIEFQNGKIERWSTEPMTRGKSLELFGVDRVQKGV